MDDSHADLYSYRTPPPRSQGQSTLQRPSRLGQTLREARHDKRLEPEDVADMTNLRLSYIDALEAGRFAELPGEPHGKNFVRLYAQAVGLDPARVLLLYAQERRTAAQAPNGLELPPETRVATLPPQLGRFTRLLASLLLVAAAIWLALRTFDGALSPGQTGVGLNQTTTTEPAAVPQATSAAAPTLPAAPAMVLLSLRTTPPGAEVSIDGYRFGQSPIVDAPVRAGDRVVRVERGGYRTFERTLDLGQDRRLSVTLLPTGVEGTLTVTGTRTVTETATATQAQAPAAPSRVVVTVAAEAWLEVYRGNTRGGERLVYETAQPGATYSFTAPVYIFSGNAGGVLVAKGDAPAQPLGTSGAVVGEAY